MAMIRKEQGKSVWFEFSTLPLKHGIFAKPCDTSHEESLEEIKNILGAKELRCLEQVHGCTVSDEGKGDALVTNVPGTALLIKHADCQAALFYDPVNHALGAAHAGWRGSVLNIYQKTIDTMNKRYGTLPKDLLAFIGPSLCPASAQFLNYKNELPESFWKYQEKPLYFNFWNISRAQLLEEGVQEMNIELAEISTFYNPELFHSYRRDKGTGRNGTAALLGGSSFP